MATIVQLPFSFDCATIQSFSGLVVKADGSPIDSEVIFDFAKLNFIDGAGITVFLNAVEWLFSHNTKISSVNVLQPLRPALSYLDDCGFFRAYLGKSISPNARPRSTTIPFQRIEHVYVHSWLESTFSPWMGAKLLVTHGALGSLRAAIKEIFHNVIDHSTLNFGFIHVQHYPKPNQIGISVADFGTGIPRNARIKSPTLADDEAILLATERGFTTKSRPNNMGVGLDFLISNIISCKGSVTIYSYCGMVRCYGLSNGDIVRTKSLLSHAYPGTLIDIRLPTIGFVGDDEDEGELIW